MGQITGPLQSGFFPLIPWGLGLELVWTQGKPFRGGVCFGKDMGRYEKYPRGSHVSSLQTLLSAGSTVPEIVIFIVLTVYVIARKSALYIVHFMIRVYWPQNNH